VAGNRLLGIPRASAAALGSPTQEISPRQDCLTLKRPVLVSSPVSVTGRACGGESVRGLPARRVHSRRRRCVAAPWPGAWHPWSRGCLASRAPRRPAAGITDAGDLTEAGLFDVTTSCVGEFSCLRDGARASSRETGNVHRRGRARRQNGIRSDCGRRRDQPERGERGGGTGAHRRDLGDLGAAGARQRRPR
jgi:hypothetical protein